MNNSGTITNYGQMYCLNGNHTINNTGIIEAKADSRTYITKNSSDEETSGNSVTRGEVKLEARDADMTVAKADYQGRISWIVPTTMATITHISGDKFNMVYLNGNCALPDNANKVKYVTIQKDAKVTMPQDLLELTANADVTLTVNKKSVAILNIAIGKTLTVPTENVIGLFDYAQSGIINATVAISNLGTMLVGGQCYSSESGASGIFASGSGNNDEAYFWGKTTADM